MNVLVTGGGGYIGSVLVPQLLKAGHRVTVLDSFMYRQNSLLDCCYDRNLTVRRGDVRDMALMRSLCEEADYIFPLACYTGWPICQRDPVAATEVIRDAVRDMVGILRPEQRIIYPNTNSGYGVGEDGIYCTECRNANYLG